MPDSKLDPGSKFPASLFEGVGRPWISSSAIPDKSEVHFVFPRLTRRITIRNSSVSGQGIFFQFITGSAPNVAQHQFLIDSSGSMTLNCYAREMWIQHDSTTATGPAHVSIYAELVPHISGNLTVYHPTGS